MEQSSRWWVPEVARYRFDVWEPGRFLGLMMGAKEMDSLLNGTGFLGVWYTVD